MNKPSNFLITLFIGLLAVLAGVPVDAGGAGKAAAGSIAEMAALEQFLSLEDEQLDQMLAALQRVRALSPQERAAMLEQIRQYRALPPEERRQLRDGWQGGRGSGRIAEQDKWRRMVNALPAAERERLQRFLQTIPQGERAPYREQLLEAWQRSGVLNLPEQPLVEP